MQRHTTGTVTLIGAGCGEGLITQKGLHALHQADVVVYDRLIDPTLLDHLTCEKIYVGKQCGHHSMKQEEINQVLIDYARKGNRVVRLKGGDSFVFGRGGEEVLALQTANIPYTLIPGVSAAIAVPAQAGIPVTHRGMAQSFTVVTGHTAHDLEEDYRVLAQLSGTLVFLMGLYHIQDITEKLIVNGKDPTTPASLISNGFTPQEVRIDGTLATIAQRAKGINPPAVLVIGPTAAMHLAATLPSLTVIGTPSFCQRFKEQYPRITSYPIVHIHPAAITIPYDDYDWIVFSSTHAVDLFFAQIDDIRHISHLQFACVGTTTAKRLASYKIKADFIPSRFDQTTLIKELPPGRALILGNDNLYHTELDTIVIDVKTDYIVFGSANGVKAFFTANTSCPAVPVCIGPSTAKELAKHVNSYLMPETHTISGIIEEIMKYETIQKTQNQ